MSSEHRLTDKPPDSDHTGREAQLPRSDEAHTILSRMATVIGRKWHPVVIYCLLDSGSLGFSELESEIDDISSKVLSEALEDLTDHGLIERTVINTRPFRVEYSLTGAGRAIEPVIVAMYEWGSEYADTTHLPE